MAITPSDKKISQMPDVAPAVGFYVPLVDLSQLPASQNVRASLAAILALATPSFASITGKPTTLAGYGITDGITASAVAAGYQPLDADLTAISALSTTPYGRGFLTLADAAAALVYIGATGGTGTVTSVSVVTANGVSGSVATATTTPAITLTLGAITPSSVNGITLSGSGSVANSGTSSLSTFTGSGTSSGTNTGDQTNISGNAATATALQTARSINGTSFNGTADITVAAAAGTLTGATLAANVTASSLLSAAGGAFGTAAFTAASAYQPIDAALTALATGSDFVVFSGPTTSNKTFTLPNASSTILTTNAAVTASQGGTGQTTYTEGDLLYGNSGGGLSKLAIQTLSGYILFSGATPSWAQLSGQAVTAITGTANEITSSASVGSVTLSLPASLTFTGKTVTGGTFLSGAFNGTVGATTPSTGAFTTIATNDLVTISNGSGGEMLRLNVAGNFVTGSPAFVTFNDGSSHNSYLGHGGVANAFDISTSISGGVIRFLPSSGTLAGSVTSTGFQGAIGATAPSTGAFTTLTVNGKTVSEGAADSGGVGFKLLRVPN
jgi:hypothetical protein